MSNFNKVNQCVRPVIRDAAGCLYHRNGTTEICIINCKNDADFPFMMQKNINIAETNNIKVMHTFDYKETPKQLLTPDIVNILSSLHEIRGKQELY